MIKPQERLHGGSRARSFQVPTRLEKILLRIAKDPLTVIQDNLLGSTLSKKLFKEKLDKMFHSDYVPQFFNSRIAQIGRTPRTIT